MNETDCCPEYAAMSRRGLFKGRVGLRRVDHRVRHRRRHRVPGVRRARSLGPRRRLAARGVRRARRSSSRTRIPAYYAARPNIAIASDALLAKDGMFGLHPAFEPLLPFWTAGKVAAVHATGLPAPNRSHFAAMEEVEDANPGSSVRSGWLNRLVGTDADANPLQGLAMGSGVAPASLYGPQPVMSAGSVERPRRGRRRRRRVGLPPDELAAHALGRQHHHPRPLDEVDLRRARVVPDRQGQPRRAGQRRRVPRQRPRPGAQGGLACHQERRRRRRAHRRPGRLGPPHRHGQRRWRPAA